MTQGTKKWFPSNKDGEVAKVKIAKEEKKSEFVGTRRQRKLSVAVTIGMVMGEALFEVRKIPSELSREEINHKIK